MEWSKKLNESLTLPATFIALSGGVLTIIFQSPWYIYSPLFLLFIFLLVLVFYKKNHYSDFNILSQEEVIEIKDTNGTISDYSFEINLTPLKQNTQDIDIKINSSGSIQNVKIENAVIDRIINEAGTSIFKILTSHPIKKGDNYRFKLNCNLVNTFILEKEYWEIEKYSKAASVKLTIFFPEKRGPKQFKAFKINGHKKEIAHNQPRLIQFNNKTALLIEIKQMTHFEKYRVEWLW